MLRNNLQLMNTCINKHKIRKWRQTNPKEPSIILMGDTISWFVVAKDVSPISAAG